MAKHSMAKAHNAWLKALEDMRAALIANPVVSDPLMASAQVFEDIGRVVFSDVAGPKNRRRKRAKAKRSPAKKKLAAHRRRRKR